MTPTEIVALIVAVGSFITAIYTQRNSATRESAALRQTEIDKQFARLTAENTQLSDAIAAVRDENTRLFKEVVEMRRELQAKDEEIFKLKRDLATERARTSELEMKVNVLTNERDAAVEKANGSRPKTGPLD